MPIKWNSKIQFPTNSDFVLCITEATFGPSKASGNPMITVEWETRTPEIVNIAGEEIDISGVKSNPMNHLYFPTRNPDDKVKEKNAIERLVGEGSSVTPPGFLRMMFPDNPEYSVNFNPDNPDAEMLKQLKGKCFYAQMGPDIQEQRKDPTKEQIEAAKKTGARPVGDVQKHPVTGKALISYNPKVREVFGLAQTAGKAF